MTNNTLDKKTHAKHLINHNLGQKEEMVETLTRLGEEKGAKGVKRVFRERAMGVGNGAIRGGTVFKILTARKVRTVAKARAKKVAKVKVGITAEAAATKAGPRAARARALEPSPKLRR